MRMRNAISIACVLVFTVLSFGQKVELPMKKDSVKFAIIGDNGTGGKQEYEVAAKLTASHEQFPFDFVVMVGDNLYGGESPKDFVDKFEKPFKALLDMGIKFHATLGNHD